MLDDLQHLLDTINHLLGQSDHLHLLFAILQHAQLLLVRQQIEHLAAVDLEEAGRHDQIQVAIAFAVQLREHIVCGQRVDAVLAVLLFTVELAAHSMRLAGTGLAVGEARGHAALEDGVDQRLGRVLVDLFVGARVVEGIVKAKFVVLQELGQIDLALGLVYDQLIFAGHTYHVQLFFHQLLTADRPLAHADGDLVVFHRDAVGQRTELDLALELTMKVETTTDN